jgi:acetolactate synthase-1/3 small subunit
MKHVLKILVNNNPGVMSHVSGLFTRRGYNIDSIAVGATEDTNYSSMTIVVHGDEYIVDQVKKNLLKLPDVIKVSDLAFQNSLARELVLLRVKVSEKNRNEVISICDVFEAKIAELEKESILIEYSGPTRKVAGLLELLKPFGVQDIARTGMVAIPYLNEW